MKDNAIVPPWDVLERWRDNFYSERNTLNEVLLEAVKWGADEELKCCSDFILPDPCCGTKFQRKILVRKLTEARRPKPKHTEITVSIAGSEAELEEFIYKLRSERKVSIDFKHKQTH
jgi:hypothetical protein